MALELKAGAASATVVPEAGGRIGQIDTGRAKLLRGPEHAALGWSQWGSYPLLPWSNRIPGGTFRFEGRECVVPVNRDDGTAIHGLAADAPWSVVGTAGDRVDIEISIVAGCYDVLGEQSFVLSPQSLDQTLSVTNRGPNPVPVGLGIHPWLAGGPVQVPADSVWSGDGPMPTGPPVAVDGDLDLRRSRLPVPMDRCFTGLTGTSARVGDVALAWSGPITQVVVYSGTPGWVCVEPVTMANDGFGLAERGVDGHGVIAAAPGDRVEIRYRFDWTAR